MKSFPLKWSKSENFNDHLGSQGYERIAGLHLVDDNQKSRKLLFFFWPEIELWD